MKALFFFIINLVNCLMHAGEIIEFISLDIEKLHSIDSIVLCTSAKINQTFHIKDLDMLVLLEEVGKVGFEKWKKEGCFKTHDYYLQMECYRKEFSYWNRFFEDEGQQDITKDMIEQIEIAKNHELYLWNSRFSQDENLQNTAAKRANIKKIALDKKDLLQIEYNAFTAIHTLASEQQQKQNQKKQQIIV